ncbi:MAG: hypothetical protein NWF04_02810 [Candidatus Bathyarchaeota archaeon]|nr:hypothetical protein [Candidatus Bathyarchaeota archaeon]
MQQKKIVADEKPEGFSLRVKMGEYEVELSGAHRDVMKTVKTLPTLIEDINKAFENVKPKTIAAIAVDNPESSPEAAPQKYPKIAASENPEDAILKALESDWGKWRPRTVEELKDAMKFNKRDYPGLVLPSILEAIVEKGLVKRWNTNDGFVYILADVKDEEVKRKIRK